MDKKLFIILFVLLIGVVALSFFTRKESTPVKQTNSQTGKVSAHSALGVAQNFYTAYQNCLQNPPEQAIGQVSTYCQANTGFTTQNFVKNLETGGVAAAGADPILCAQNTPEKIEAQSMSEQTLLTARVNVNLIFGEMTQTNKVDLINEDGVWKVDNIMCPQP
jgi:hypothetical protein